jgi:hypothetical protein
MNKVTTSISTLLLLLLLSCGGNKMSSLSSGPGEKRTPTSNGAPIKTSIGDLTGLEKKDSVATSEKKIVPKPEEVLYLLTFEGKSEITYEGKTQQDGPNRILLIDAKGKEYVSEFAGTPAKDGTLSDKEWKYNGGMKAVNGRFVFAGTMTLPEPRIALAYLIPKDVSSLTLKDGNQKHSID